MNIAGLAHYLETNPEGFDIDQFGLITNPGRFEREPLWVPYFYELAMHGFGDESGEVWDAIRLEPAERALVDDSAADWVVLHYSDSGLITGELATEWEFRDWLEALEREQEEDYTDA